MTERSLSDPDSVASNDSGLRTLKVGTRGSRLARWQADWVADQLRQRFPEVHVEIVEVHTRGDRDRATPLAQMGGLGLFTKEIQRALLDHRVDLAVHSLKDLPTATTEGLRLAAVPTREVCSDALIAPRAKTLEALPVGGKVGTGSPRRRAQLLHLRPDLEVVSVRGNVETRLNLALQGDLDGVVLAEAGLNRLGLADRITERLEPPRVLPAVGQGALGLECRVEDGWTTAHIVALDDSATRRAVQAERSVLASLQAGCMAPMGAWGRFDEDDRLRLDVVVLDSEGHQRLEVSLVNGPDESPEQLGRRAADRLREQGADDLMASNTPIPED